MIRRGQDAWISVPPRPVIELVLDDQGRGTVNGRQVPIEAPEDPQASLLAEAVRQAVELSRPVRVRAADPDGVWHLIAHPDGTVSELSDDATDPGATDPGADTGTGAPFAADYPGSLLRDPGYAEEAYDDGPWHLRVHPNGDITPVDDDPIGLPPAALSPPAPRSPGRPVPAPVTPEAGHPAAGWLPPEPEPEAVAEPDTTAEPEPDAVAEPEAVAEPDTTTAPEPVAEEDADAAEASEEEADAAEASEEGAGTGSPDPIEAWLRTLPRTGGPEAGTIPRRPAPPAAAHDGTGTQDTGTLVDDLRSTLDESAPPRRRRLPLRSMALLGAGVVAVSAVGVFLVRGGGTAFTPSPAPASTRSAEVTASAGRRTAAAPAAPGPARVPPTLAHPPAKLSVAPPPGFLDAPEWALPISPASTSVVAADGRVLTLTGDGQVALIDPVTGAVRWHATAPEGGAGPHLARIDGRDVAAVMTADQLTYWPLPAKATAKADDTVAPTAVSVELPAGAAVSWTGPSPLLVLGNGAAAVIRGGGIQQVNLPSRMRPLAADGADILAASGRNWIRQPAGQAAGAPLQLTVPKGATGPAPIRVENVGGSFLATMWTSPDGPIVAVVDAHSGANVVQTTFPKDVDFTRAPTVREPGSERTAVGSALFEPAQHNLSILASTFTPVALTPGHVFADDASGAVADLRIKGKDLIVVPFKGKNPLVPVGIATSGTTPVAVVAAPYGDGWLLCGLPMG
jgi:hypothetical protein